MKYKLITMIASIGLLGGCATQAPTESPEPIAPPVPGESVKLSVTQIGRGQNANHVFCEEGKCPNRTQKVIALPPEQKPPVALAPATTETFTVHFRWAWAKLDESGEKEFLGIVARVKDKQVKKIEVAGRTDPTGSKKFNEQLALRRAETIKASLVRAGFAESLIQTSAQKPCCDGDLKASPGVMQQLRRTDLEITITTK